MNKMNKHIYIKKYFRLIVVLFALFSSQLVLATEYKINNANDLKQLTLVAGDVVIMQNGKWENERIILKAIGTAEAPITLKAETAGSVVLTGTSTLSLAGEYLVVDGLAFKNGALDDDQIIAFRTSSSSEANHSRLTNCQIIDYNPESKDTEYKWVSMYGTYNRVDHCHFENKTHNGALLVIWLDGDPNYHTIDSNYFGKRPDLGYNGGEIIRVGTSDYSMSDSYTLVENNLFEECDGEIEIISNKSCQNIYRNNTFRNSEGCMTLRHGNDCEVYNNFFFGVTYKNCGGIRIIGENHKVYNNYLENIPGDGYRAAISITNGVPDSPLNRYFQVKNAQIVNNTLVNCKHPFYIGAGADEEKSLPPLDCEIGNNVVAIYSGYTEQIFEYNAEPINMGYTNNMVYGSDVGIDVTEGILVNDPSLVESDFYRPTDTSKVIGFGSIVFDFVTFDIDKQDRTTTNDAGCDQISDQAMGNKPLNKEDVGTGWANAIKEVSADEGGQKLQTYIETANENDVIILSTSGGVYTMSESSLLLTSITLRAAYGLNDKPVIKAIGHIDEFINIQQGASLSIENIEIDGGSLSDHTFTKVITVDESCKTASSVNFDHCFLHDFTQVNRGMILDANAPVNELTTSYTQIYNVATQGFAFNQVSATTIELSNSTFAQFGQEFLSLDLDLSDLSQVYISHCTIDSIAYENDELFAANFEESNVSISNTIISSSHRNTPVFNISGSQSIIDYTVFWNCGEPTITNDAKLGDNVWINEDPLYAAREQFVFSFLQNSFALSTASDGNNLGDLFWDINNGQPNNNALLEIITINKIPIVDFESNKFEYRVDLTDTLNYSIHAITQDYKASKEILNQGITPDTAYIYVEADNGVNKHTYTVIVNSVTTGINTNVIQNQCYIYPNPSNGLISISNAEMGQLKIFNSAGQKVHEQHIIGQNASINLSHLQHGIYFAQIESAKGKYTKKLVIKP